MNVLGFGKVSKVVVVVIGLILLVAVVGWIGDIVALRSLKHLSSSSLEHFSEFKRIGYEKPAYYPKMKDGEAWDMYARAVTLVESSNKEDMNFITKDFMGKVDGDTARAASVVAASDSIIGCIKEGVRRKKCASPLNYEEGFAMQLPNYTALRTAAKLMACRAGLRAKHDPQSAVQDMIDGAIFAQDLAGGDLALIGHMIGIVCLGISARETHDALDKFYLNEPQLERLASTMNTLAKTWPPLSRNLGTEWRGTAVSLYGLRLREMVKIDLFPTKGLSNQFFYWWFTHLLSWRQLFSFRRAQLGAIEFQMRTAQDLAEAEQEGWDAVNSAVNIWESKIKNSGNWFLRVLTPNIMSMHARRFEGITKARLAGAGALVEIYFLKNRRWPDKLELVRRDGLEDLLIDPMSSGQLKYIVYPGADSVAVYSVWTNRVDDGGVMGEERKDRVLVLHRPEGS